MKFFSTSLPEIINKIQQKQIKALLLHGVNNGLAQTIIKQIVKKLDLTISEIEFKEITLDRLNLLANSTNFFKQKEMIKITNCKNILTKDLQQGLEESDFENFICFVSQDSLPPSGMRKFFENSKYLASIGCYYENEGVISKIILQQCKKNQKDIDQEALLYLQSYLKGDNQMIKSELEKIFNFTHDKATITRHDIELVTSPDALANGDEMSIYFAQKKPDKFLKEVEKLKLQGVNEVLMIRALARYYMNIYLTTARVENGEHIDVAIKKLAPPIFFKYVSSFKKIVMQLSSKRAIAAVRFIQEAEIEFKQNYNNFDLFSLYAKINNSDL